VETAPRHTEDLSLNTSLVRSLLVSFLRDETRNAGFMKGVIGLSGGVDSSVAAYLAAEALGPGNVQGVIMPYKTSGADSQRDAGLVVEKLGIKAETVDITPMVDPLLRLSKIEDRVRAGNIMARQRMIILYDRSGRENALVIGTSNKTEILLGYGTLFGDTACAINPLGDLYKTQVWQLAESLGVPKVIVEKPPSADLWQGQTDEGEMGFSYTRVDQLLYSMIDERRSDDDLRSLGFEDAFVQKVKKLIVRNQFKRRMPLIAKISNRTVNVDFRYPRDWGI
jgi:NAD+ synthase